jgi:hypothetical protein
VCSSDLSLFTVVFFTWVVANAQDAEERIVEVWACTLNDDQTQEDVQTTNTKWVAFMNAQVVT